MKIQLDIPEELNDKLKINRIKKKLKNKEEMILFILERYFNKLKGGSESVA